MSTTDIDADDLTQALEDAAPHIVIPGADEPIDVDTYRDKLRKVRRAHDVDNAQFVLVEHQNALYTDTLIDRTVETGSS